MQNATIPVAVTADATPIAAIAAYLLVIFAPGILRHPLLLNRRQQVPFRRPGDGLVTPIVLGLMTTLTARER